MCVGVVEEAGQESSCATRFVANGEMWLTIHFCWREGRVTRGALKKKIAVPGQRIVQTYAVLWYVVRRQRTARS